MKVKLYQDDKDNKNQKSFISPKRKRPTSGELNLFLDMSPVFEPRELSILSPAKKQKKTTRENAVTPISPVKKIIATDRVLRSITNEQKTMNEVSRLELNDGEVLFTKLTKSNEQVVKELLGSAIHRAAFEILLGEKRAGKSHLVLINNQEYLGSIEIKDMSLIKTIYSGATSTSLQYQQWQNLQLNFKTNLLTVFITSVFIFGNADPNLSNLYYIGQKDEAKCGVIDFERVFSLKLPDDLKMYAYSFSAHLDYYLKIDLSNEENSNLIKNVVGTILRHKNSIKEVYSRVFSTVSLNMPIIQHEYFHEFSFNLHNYVKRKSGEKVRLYDESKLNVTNKFSFQLMTISYIDDSLGKLAALYNNWNLYSYSAIAKCFENSQSAVQVVNVGELSDQDIVKTLPFVSTTQPFLG